MNLRTFASYELKQAIEYQQLYFCLLKLKEHYIFNNL